MKCWDCPHFHIVQEPIRAGNGGYWDLGMARCEKLKLVVDFANHGKLKKLECVEKDKKEMKAIWGMDYDYKTDKCFNRPMCPECDAPICKNKDGNYECVSCLQPVEVDDAIMLKWLTDREETKVEMHDCPRITHEGHSYGCGGKACVETLFVKNKVTLEWQIASGTCTKCGMKFIV